MTSLRTIARSIGILFLLATLIGMAGILLKDLAGETDNSDLALRTIAGNTFRINASIFCDILSNSFLLWLTVLFFSIIKNLNRTMAHWYLAMAVIGFAIDIVGNTSVMSLLSLTQDYVKHPRDADLFWRLGRIKRDDFLGAHFFTIFVNALGLIPLYIVLFQAKLVPRFLSAWGVLASSIVFVAAWLLIFDIGVNLLLFFQNAIFIIVLSIWLIVKGFNNEAVPFISHHTKEL